MNRFIKLICLDITGGNFGFVYVSFFKPKLLADY